MDIPEDDPVRAPDAVIVDRLNDAPQTDYEFELAEAIHQSQNAFLADQIAFEQNVVQTYRATYQSRKKVFEKLLFDLQKVGRIDKDIQFVYDLLEPVLEAYCAQYIETCNLGAETHAKVFRLLKSVRTDKEAIEALNSILISSSPVEPL